MTSRKHNFEKLNIEAPMYVLDIKPRISDVIKKYEDVLDPIFHFVNTFQTKRHQLYQFSMAINMKPYFLLTILLHIS